MKFPKFKPKRKKLRSLPWRDIAPNMVTSGNLVSGVVSLILSFHGHYVAAGWMIFAAVFFDFMDGKVARSLGGGSQFGLEFDSIADVVSFGAAPAMLMYAVYFQMLPIIGGVISCFFALCGGLRLARFNVIHSPGSFQGIPIPAAGLFVSSFVIAEVKLNPFIAMIIVLISALLMVSSVPYGSLKTMRKGYANKKKFTFLFTLMLLIAVLGRQCAPLILMSIYVISGLVHFDWGKWLSIAVSDEDIGKAE